MHAYRRCQRARRSFVPQGTDTWLSGDGCLCIREERHRKAKHWEIRFYPDDEDIWVCFLQSFKILFGKDSHVHDFATYYDVRLTCKPIAQEILTWGDLGTSGWRMPVLADDVSASAWLSAFFDAEAYVGDCLTVQSVNSEGLQDVRRGSSALV